MGCYFSARQEERKECEAMLARVIVAREVMKKRPMVHSTSVRRKTVRNSTKRKQVEEPKLTGPLMVLTDWTKIRAGGQGVVGSAYTRFGNPGMMVRIAVKTFLGRDANIMFFQEHKLLTILGRSDHVVSLLGSCLSPPGAKEGKQIVTSTYSLILEYIRYSIDYVWEVFISPLPKNMQMQCIKSLAYQLIASVDDMNKKGIMHGDISRGNIMFSAKKFSEDPSSFGDLTLRLVDFGLGRASSSFDKALYSICSGTHFFAANYWFNREACLELSSIDADLFQAMMVIVHFIGDTRIWHAKGKMNQPRPYAAIMQTIGNKYLESNHVQSHGWLDWLINHSVTDCEAAVHGSFCKSLTQFFSAHKNLARLLSSTFSPLTRKRLSLQKVRNDLMECKN
jgi:serine/threonine protein kinase